MSVSEITSSVYPPQGGNGSVQITTARECAWSATSDVPWVKLRNSNGQGDGVVDFTVESNTASAARNGRLSVNDQRRAVSQQGTPCGFELSSNREIVDAAGGERTVLVRASARDCAWAAAADVPWLTIVGGREGLGDGAVTFRVDRDDGPARTGTIAVAGQQIQVAQGNAVGVPGPVPAPAPGCSYVIVPDDVTVPAGGMSTPVQLSTGPGCAWTAASTQSWIAISAASGTGPSRLQLTVSPNAGLSRAGSASIAGRALGVVQANGCTYSVAPQTPTVSSVGGSGSFTVTTAPLCPWSVSGSPSWIQIAGPSGAGPASIGFIATPNASPDRSATFTIAGQQVTVTQPSQCTFELAPPFHEFDAAGGNGNVLVIVSGPCSWTASTSADWIKMTAGTAGTGNGLVQFVVPPNPGGARRDHVSIAGRNYVVTQAGR